MTETVGVVGAGLVGCLAALAFAKKGYKVTLFDLRSDPKTVKNKGFKSLRSINLAVSDRGIRALKAVDEDMAQRILQNVIPMKGRMIHDLTGKKQESQVYGLFGESIKSIDRLFLNMCLLEELERTDVEVLFDHKLVALSDTSSNEMRPQLLFSLKDETTVTYDFHYVIGTDGAHSQTRYHMQKIMRMDYSQTYIDMQYMELSIPPVPGKNAQCNPFSIDPNHLHIWPRKDYMLIALPNGDGSFTSTFFSPWKVIESIENTPDFLAFFRKSFPDAYDLIGEDGLRHSFENQPRGSLMQVSVDPYASPNNRAILLGDAAHSMVPFYGQGMNCGFEDVHVLTRLVDENKGRLDVAIGKYTGCRKTDLDAICKLALDNYYEMSTKVTDPFYLLRKKIDYYLGKYANGVLFQWVPMYSMISFRGDILYAEAVSRERKQTRVLNWIQYMALGSIAVVGAAKAAQVYERYTT